MRESIEQRVAWRRYIGRRSEGPAAPAPAIATGHEPIDDFLDGGIKRGHLHEIFGEQAEGVGGAAGFAAMLGVRAGEGTGGPLLWLRTGQAERKGGMLYAPGFAELGGDPARLLLLTAPDELALLRAAADALRCSGLAGLIIECWGRPRLLDLTATRRLTLAAARSGVTALLLRLGAGPTPSTAETRWSVEAAPSVPLEANAPGRPAFEASLLRNRSGIAGKSWRLEWDRERRRFSQPALPGALVPVPAGREGAQTERLAAAG